VAIPLVNPAASRSTVRLGVRLGDPPASARRVLSDQIGPAPGRGLRSIQFLVPPIGPCMPSSRATGHPSPVYRTLADDSIPRMNG
jgi:hypothetical protein